MTGGVTDVATKIPFPDKYLLPETSGLTYTVNEGLNTIDVEMKDSASRARLRSRQPSASSSFSFGVSVLLEFSLQAASCTPKRGFQCIGHPDS